MSPINPMKRSRHLRRAALALVAALGIGSLPGHAQSSAPDSYIPGEVVVKLKRAEDLPGLLSQYAGYGLSVISQFGVRPIYQLNIGNGTDSLALAQSLSLDARVQYAEPNFLNQTPESRKAIAWAIGGDSVTFATQWAPNAIRLPEAHAYSVGAGITVAVLDTGIDDQHPVFANRLRAGFDFVDFDNVPREEGSRANLGYGHGTHVAGLVALAAPAAAIMPIRVLDPNGVGNIWVLAEGLLHAVDPDGNPQTNDGAQVINLSLGTTRKTSLLEDIVGIASCSGDDDDDDDAAGSVGDAERCTRFGGAVVIAAAGNSGNETPHYPASEGVEGALSVGASTQANALSIISTRGDRVQIAAPGESIIGPVPGGGYGVWTGTSMAAPFVAGAAALMRSGEFGYKWPKPTDIANQLVSTGATLCGTGIKQLDIAAALSGTSGPGTNCP
jgi:subtilisin family serine protease